jgi:hypothetical protein
MFASRIPRALALNGAEYGALKLKDVRCEGEGDAKRFCSIFSESKTTNLMQSM